MCKQNPKTTAGMIYSKRNINAPDDPIDISLQERVDIGGSMRSVVS